MQAKSLFSISAQLIKTENPSILEAATKVFVLLRKLSEFDPIFRNVEHFSGSKISNVKIEDESAISRIAQLILNSEWNEITQYEGEKRPTVNYRRKNSGFSFNSKFIDENGERFYFNLGCGFLRDGVTFYAFSRKFEYDFQWYDNLIKILVSELHPYYATVKLNYHHIMYNEMNMKYDIGWVTYFSDLLEIEIPRDIKGLKCELVDGGQYLYTANDDIFKNKDAYSKYISDLKRIVSELKDRESGFVLDQKKL